MKALWYGVRLLVARVVKELVALVLLPVVGLGLLMEYSKLRSTPAWIATLLNLACFLALLWAVHAFGEWGLRPQSPTP